jgi:hypothetical protein
VAPLLPPAVGGLSAFTRAIQRLSRGRQGDQAVRRASEPLNSVVPRSGQDSAKFGTWHGPFEAKEAAGCSVKWPSWLSTAAEGVFEVLALSCDLSCDLSHSGSSGVQWEFRCEWNCAASL